MIDLGNWPEMRRALTVRDIGRVFRLLADSGMQQRRIADLVGMSQSEVSEILSGRQVMAYDVLLRVANGLEVPHGAMGLSYGEDGPPPVDDDEVTEEMKRRALLAVGTTALLGAPILGQVLELPTRPPTPTPLPSRLAASDVEVMTNLTAGLRGVAREYGGCADVVTATARRSLAFLSVPATDEVSAGMRLAIGELHTLAGWCCVDSGYHDAARAHFAKAMELGDLSGAFRHSGIQMCDGGHYDDGLKAFQLALMKDPDDPWLHLETAKPYAELGDHRAALAAVARARQVPQTDPFDVADMEFVTGRVYERLGKLDQAQSFIMSAVGKWGRLPDAKRDRVEADIALAALHVRAGASDGPMLAVRAIQGVMPLRSVRARSKLVRLTKELDVRGGSTYSDLARQARTVQQLV